MSGAAVPFHYDVHAMMFSEDAPALENMLHRHFDSRRVNLVNLRREFFHVTLDEIREAVKKHFGLVTFHLVPEAEEYRKTLAIRQEMAGPSANAPVAVSIGPQEAAAEEWKY